MLFYNATYLTQIEEYRLEMKISFLFLYASEKMSKLWGVIMRGLETIRLVVPNALPLTLVVHIAKTLDARVC